MTKFEALKSVTDSKKYAELVFDLVEYAKTPEKLAELLSEEFTEKGLQTIKSIARSGYPLSFERKQ